MKYVQTEAVNINENSQNNFKTNLFEIENEIVELKLSDDCVSRPIKQESTDKLFESTKFNGKWVVVNGNFIKNDSKILNSDQG